MGRPGATPSCSLPSDTIGTLQRQFADGFDPVADDADMGDPINTAFRIHDAPIRDHQIVGACRTGQSQQEWCTQDYCQQTTSLMVMAELQVYWS